MAIVSEFIDFLCDGLEAEAAAGYQNAFGYMHCLRSVQSALLHADGEFVSKVWVANKKAEAAEARAEAAEARAEAAEARAQAA
ncbi:MAG: hypothetical protein HQL87_07660 [Magnetococcales bacterium]|nr:hypothetical protein [Magnetococcales bacterium]